MPTIDLPAGFASSTTAQISTFFNSFSPIILIIIGLLGVSLVISIIIGAIRGNH